MWNKKKRVFKNSAKIIKFYKNKNKLFRSKDNSVIDPWIVGLLECMG